MNQRIQKSLVDLNDNFPINNGNMSRENQIDSIKITSISNGIKNEERKTLNNLIMSRRPDFTISCSVGNNKIINVPINLISDIESDGVLCKFHYHSTQSKFVRIAHSIRECEESLKGLAFLRVHRFHLINCSFLQSFQCKREGIILLTNGKNIPVSRRRKNQIVMDLKSFGFDHLLEGHKVPHRTST